MAWNCPVNGDWSVVDGTKAPWASGVMTLTHDEVLYVIEALPPIEEEFSYDLNMVISKYNQLSNWEKAINGDTYGVIKGYEPEVHTQGIDANGIVGLAEPFVEEEKEGDV